MRKRKATRSEIIERNRKIVKDYEDGLSFEQLSEKYGLCVRTCYRALDEEQQAQRIAEEQDHANLVDKIVAEYQKNTRVRDIAEKGETAARHLVSLPQSYTAHSIPLTRIDREVTAGLELKLTSVQNAFPDSFVSSTQRFAESLRDIKMMFRG